MQANNKVVVIVDTENVSFDKVFSYLNTYVKYDLKDTKYVGTWCFGLEDNKSDISKTWRKECDELQSYHWRGINRERKKNLVDDAIVENIDKLLADSRFDGINHYVLVTSDGDFSDLVEKLKSKGKLVTIMATNEISSKLKNICDKWIRAY